jgi:hypothetical protein
VRDGAQVDHHGFDDLDEAVAAMRSTAMRIRAEAPPKKTANLIKTFEPRDQVQARLELKGRGLRARAAGIDVRGDGTFVPYRGGLRREELDPTHHDTPFDLVRETLEER